MTTKEVLALIREKEVKSVDLRFMDFPGIWQRFAVPAETISEATFEDGLGFDGSSIRGWQAINESDMLVKPQADTAVIDPFMRHTTLAMICNIHDPLTGEEYARDPRNVARKAVNHMRALGAADAARFGSDTEFHVFDEVRFGEGAAGAAHRVRGPARRGEPADDRLSDLRAEMVLRLEEVGIQVEAQRHAPGSHSQVEIDLRHGDLVRAADRLLWHKYVVKQVARQHGKSATFMPKPTYGEKGSGLRCNLSLWRGGDNLFAGSGYAGLSDMAMHAIGGILRHAPALCAIANPTTNSYKRLAGPEAPVHLAYSRRNRAAAVRVPVYAPDRAAKRVEFRSPDCACNPYLTFAAVLMAVLDGVQRKLDPGPALDKDVYDLPPEELESVPKAPATLEEALDHLERDHDFLLRGDVFTPDVISTWIWYKRTREADAVRLRPHPHEFTLYYDA